MVKSKFLKSAGTVALGTLMAQALGAAMMPVLTRLYGPSEFSDFSQFISFVYILSSIICLRFEVAIPITKNEQDAKNLILLSVITNLFISILVFLILSSLTISSDVKNIAYISIASFLMGVMNTFHFYFVRLKRYKTTSKCKVLQIVAQSICQVICFFLIPTIGLLLGQIALAISGILFYGFGLFFLNEKSKFTVGNLKKVFLKHSDYPKFSTLEALFNVSSIYLPIIIISHYTDSNDAGYILLAMRLLQMPLSLIGNSIAQVYISEAKIKHEEYQLYTYSKMVLGKLTTLGVPVIFFIGIIAPFTFEYIFGSEWERAGYYVLYMTPWFIMQFISSPISMALYAIGKQKLAMFLQLSGMIIRCTLVIIAVLFYMGYESEFYFISGFIFYAVYFFVVMKSIKNSERLS
ncbi:lipopolysaccharide biosynthesis protein [Vibrio proteolyticus]